ncbi:MAG: hypothetical protein KDC09_13085 [Bacteroidales bacterium]|nr:hypothetical protein [Bacteroidales bacterium]
MKTESMTDLALNTGKLSGIKKKLINGTIFHGQKTRQLTKCSKFMLQPEIWLCCSLILNNQITIFAPHFRKQRN